jgi:hypothetical protein
MAAQPIGDELVEVVLTRRLIDEARELERVRAFAEELARLIRERDPQATFTLEPPIDPGIWVLNAFLTPPLDEDPDFLDAVRDRRVEMQIHDRVSIAIIALPRRAAALATPTAGQPPKPRRRK